VRITIIQDCGNVRGSVFPLPASCINALGSAVEFSILTFNQGVAGSIPARPTTCLQKFSNSLLS